MPTTARWHVHGVQGRSDCIDYIKNPKKTEGGILVTGVNCSSDFADYEMRRNNERFHIEENNDSRTCYHGYQSFDPKEKNLTPEEAHQIGVELVKRLYPNFQCVVSTHTDQAHIHNHFVINSTDMSGRKLEDRLANPLEGLYGLRDASDKLALEHGLKIIEDEPVIGRYHKNRYLYNLANASWRSQIIEMLESLKERCFSFDELLENLALEGYQIKSGKNIRVRPQGKERFVTLKVLGEEYSEDSLKEFFFNKRKNQTIFTFEQYKLNDEDSEILKLYNELAINSKHSVLYSMKNLDVSGVYPKYYNSRYLEVKRYNKLVDTINFLNEHQIYNYNDLQDQILKIREDIILKEEAYQEQVSLNETLQVRVPLCRLYLQYLPYYESYIEQLDIVKQDVEPSNEVKAFLDVKEELNVSSPEEVKQILSSANQQKAETNRQYAYLSYMKNKANELEKIKSISLEGEKGYIKSVSISKNMIDEKRSNAKEYCIRIPYSELYIYVPVDSVCWISYDNRAIVYLIDDKEYVLYDKYNKEQEIVNGENIESISQSEKQKVNEYYKSYQA